MPNELPIGSRRNGDLIDSDPSTPEVKVTLERTEAGISLTVPWSDPTSSYARWSVDGSVTFDDVKWSRRRSRQGVYDGLKHANRVAPDEFEILNVWREGVLVMRDWVALRRGISGVPVRDWLAEDPQSHPYIRWT